MRSIRVEVVRGGMVESWHEVSVALADARGRLLAAWGDVERMAVTRSAIKPWQALPLVEDGVATRFGVASEELALACGSHGGAPHHVAAARSLLGRIGLDEDALACGPHPPVDRAAAKALLVAGEAPGRLHNNCSGKHAGMLALARHHGWPVAGYHEAGHPVQKRMLAEVTRWTGSRGTEVPTGVDGCGVVTFGVPLARLAMGFARFAAAAAAGDHAARIVDSMVRHPEYVAGDGRLCTELMREGGGRLFAKVGADAVYAIGVPAAGAGFALKVHDGGRRAVAPAVLAVLRHLDLLPASALERLAAHAEPAVRNTREEVVGRIRAVVAGDACGPGSG